MGKKKRKQIVITLTEEELDRLNKKVEKSMFNRSAFCRLILNGAELREAPNPDFYKLIAAVKDVGSKLDSILHKLNYQRVIDITALKEALDSNWEAEKLLWETFDPVPVPPKRAIRKKANKTEALPLLALASQNDDPADTAEKEPGQHNDLE